MKKNMLSITSLLALGMVHAMTNTENPVGSGLITQDTPTPENMQVGPPDAIPHLDAQGNETGATVNGVPISVAGHNLAQFHISALEHLGLPGTLVSEFELYLYERVQSVEQMYGKGAGAAKKAAVVAFALDWLDKNILSVANHLPFIGVVLAIPGIHDGLLTLARSALTDLLGVVVERAFALLNGAGLVN